MQDEALVLQPAHVECEIMKPPPAEALVLQTVSGYHTAPAIPQLKTNMHRARTIQPMK